MEPGLVISLSRLHAMNDNLCTLGPCATLFYMLVFSYEQILLQIGNTYFRYIYIERYIFEYTEAKQKSKHLEPNFFHYLKI